MRQKDQHKKLRLGVMQNYQKDYESVRKADNGYEARFSKSIPILNGQREDWMTCLANLIR